MITCSVCSKVQEPGDWRCCECDANLEYGIEMVPCEHCGEVAMHRRHRLYFATLCECRLTEAQRAAVERRRNRALRQAEMEALAQQERELQEQRRRAMRYKAAQCWDELDRQCRISALPFDFCNLCPRFSKPVQSLPVRQSVGLVKMQDIEVDCA